MDRKFALWYQERYLDFHNSQLKSSEAAWNHQQERIDRLEEWMAAIADDHPQIPDWIQQSARSLLAQESVDYNDSDTCSGKGKCKDQGCPAHYAACEESE